MRQRFNIEVLQILKYDWSLVRYWEILRWWDNFALCNFRFLRFPLCSDLFLSNIPEVISALDLSWLPLIPNRFTCCILWLLLGLFPQKRFYFRFDQAAKRHHLVILFLLRNDTLESLLRQLFFLGREWRVYLCVSIVLTGFLDIQWENLFKVTTVCLFKCRLLL